MNSHTILANERDAGMAAVGDAATLIELFLGRVAQTPDRAALCVVETPASAAAKTASLRSWTWAELAAAAVRAARDLEAAGLSRGNRVVHLGPHSVDWIVADLACLLAGLVHVPLHADAAAREHRTQLAWLDPRGVIFSGRGSRPFTASDLAGRSVVVGPAEGWLTAATEGGGQRVATDLAADLA